MACSSRGLLLLARQVFEYFVKAQVAADATWDQILEYTRLFYQSVASVTRRSLEEARPFLVVNH